ncbi:MAG TPA: hypothetical protein VEX39_18725, partial [Thermoleophilaceae bacterium]|nr:hypothetical protein [Thermoleophilaceae bacterium]
DDQPRWWTFNKAAHRRIVHAAGFEVVDNGGPLFQPFGDHNPRWPKHVPRTPREWLYWVLVRQVGASSGWVRARAGTG